MRSPSGRFADEGVIAGVAQHNDAMTIFDHPINTLAGEPTSLAEHDGEALLLVNVASKCGLTPQYTGLEELQKHLRRPRVHASSASRATSSAARSPAPPRRSRRSARPPTA